MDVSNLRIKFLSPAWEQTSNYVWARVWTQVREPVQNLVDGRVWTMIEGQLRAQEPPTRQLVLRRPEPLGRLSQKVYEQVCAQADVNIRTTTWNPAIITLRFSVLRQAEEDIDACI